MNYATAPMATAEVRRSGMESAMEILARSAEEYESLLALAKQKLDAFIISRPTTNGEAVTQRGQVASKMSAEFQAFGERIIRANANLRELLDSLDV